MEVEVIETLSDRHVDDLLSLYEGTYWADGRTGDEVRRMLARTDVTVGLEATDSGRLVAFARALTDGTYRAFLEDVIVAEEFRGEGFGADVVEAVLSHPEVEGVESVTLGCEDDLVEFYRTFGFETLAEDMRVMNLER